MRRGCFLTVVILLVLCLVACGLGYFVGIPRVRDSAREGMEDAISTTVAEQIPATGGIAQPGTYEITEDELQAEISGNVDVQNVNDLVIDLAPSGITFRITTNGDQDLTYTGRPEVVDGQLRMEDMEASEGFLDWIFPADDLGEAIEDAVNNHLAENNLELESLDLTNEALTLETVAAS